jgi:hypothetical protein
MEAKVLVAYLSETSYKRVTHIVQKRSEAVEIHNKSKNHWLINGKSLIAKSFL